MLRQTPGDPWGVEQHHWNTGATYSDTRNMLSQTHMYVTQDKCTWSSLSVKLSKANAKF